MQQFCLRWNNHQPNFISVFSSLLNNETLVDVTLAAEGRHLQAHKVVLSACSTYFQSLFTVNPCQHPIVILKDVKFSDLKIMVDFMYYGEVNVSQDQLPSIIKVKTTQHNKLEFFSLNCSHRCLSPRQISFILCWLRKYTNLICHLFFLHPTVFRPSFLLFLFAT